MSCPFSGLQFIKTALLQVVRYGAGRPEKCGLQSGATVLFWFTESGQHYQSGDGN
tara:strand:- start:474 stop:638 length:165 start_codon:yes stop_codon:yes gene_type:complete